ncbi:hypothetical protein BH23ACT2_BH23ACT2_19510 [soil metagenome]
MSPTGRTVALLAVAGLSALWLPAVVAGVAVGAVAALWLGDAWVVRRPPTLRRSLPTEVARGVGVDVELAVEHRPGVAVSVRQPQTADVRLDPAQGADGFAATLVVARRGRHLLAPPVTRSTGPLGLARWVHRHGAELVLNAHADLPGARRIATAVRQGSFRDPGMRRGPLGLGTDFESVRDYLPDDDVRHINWLATERTGRPMVNQYREDTERDLWCLIDAGRLLSAPVGDRTRLDVALDALAAVAAVADVVGDRVGAVVFAGEVQRVVRPRRASAAGLVRLLDDLEPTIVDSDYEAAFARVAAAKRSLVVVFTDLLDAAAAAPLLDAVPVLARRHAVVLAGVTDPDLVAAVATDPTTRRELHVATVATDLLAERDQVRVRLTAAGALVVDAAVEDLPSACVAAYLRLKSTARL